MHAAHEASKVDELDLCSRCSYRPSWLEWYSHDVTGAADPVQQYTLGTARVVP